MDVTNLIVNKLQAHIINETMVLPNMDEWPMPYWPESYDPAGACLPPSLSFLMSTWSGFSFPQFVERCGGGAP